MGINPNLDHVDNNVFPPSLPGAPRGPLCPGEGDDRHGRVPGPLPVLGDDPWRRHQVSPREDGPRAGLGYCRHQRAGGCDTGG